MLQIITFIKLNKLRFEKNLQYYLLRYLVVIKNRDIKL